MMLELLFAAQILCASSSATTITQESTSTVCAGNSRPRYVTPSYSGYNFGPDGGPVSSPFAGPQTPLPLTAWPVAPPPAPGRGGATIILP